MEATGGAPLARVAPRAGGTAESRTTSGRAAAPEDGEGTCRTGATGQDSRCHSFWELVEVKEWDFQ